MRARCGSWKRIGVAVVAWLGLGGPAAAEPVVVLGDSWGVLVSGELDAVLEAEGFGPGTVANESTGGSKASEWAAGDFDLPGIFAAHPDAEVVHISLGGNDLIAAAGSPNPLAELGPIADDVAAVAVEVASLTSAGILISGYDYLPNPPLPVAQANFAQDALIGLIANSVANEPALDGRAVVVNTNGLMQVHYGVGGLPPFDPGLPDNTLPGPAAAYDDAIHLTPAGYAILSQEWFDRAYGCSDGLDGDGDGLVDLADPGCTSGLDLFETNHEVACDDGFDDDGDGFVDLADPGCRFATSTIEDPQCQDGIDNDGHLGTDFDGGDSVLGVGNGDPNGADPQCVDAWRDREAPAPACGLGPEMAVLGVGMLGWRARRRRPNAIG